MTTLYMVQFVNAGNRDFVHHGKQLRVCTISSQYCTTEKRAIANLLDILFAKGAVFRYIYEEFENDEEENNLSSHILKTCMGDVVLLNECFPDQGCSVELGGEFCFELKRFSIESF